MYKKPSSANVRKPYSQSTSSQQRTKPSKYGNVNTSQSHNTSFPNDKKNETNNKENAFKSKNQHIINVVKQYLLSHGYNRSYQALKRQKPLPKILPGKKSTISNPQTSRQQDDRLLIRMFERGQRQEFFKHANKWLNQTQGHTSKLQFELNIYFCIYAVHPLIRKSTSIDKAALEAFKKFIENRGSQISNCDQYLNFFSLPYIPRPQDNPALAYVFTKDWLSMLKQKVQNFLKQNIQKSGSTVQSSSKQIRKKSQLQEMFDLYVQSKNESGQEKIQSKQTIKKVQQQLSFYQKQLEQLKSHNQQLLKYIQKLSNSIQVLEDASKTNLIQSNKKWFVFSRDIIMLVKKQTKNMKIQGLQRYERFFGKNIQQMINNADISFFDKANFTADDYSMLRNENKSMNSVSVSKRPQISSQIDMVKIQTLFANADDPNNELKICILLKALKNRFSRLRNPYSKRQIIVQYTRHDICGITPQKYYIQKRLLVDGSEKIKQFYLRLMNEICSDIYGIQYLTKSEKLIQNLMKLMNNQLVEETPYKKYTLGILQKFSYPKKPRKKMIDLGIVPLIFKLFQVQGQQIEDFTAQYLTAMIMNLAMKQRSQKHFTPYKSQLILILMTLLQHQSQQIKNYTNGSLYLLLNYRQIMQQAKRLGLQQKIQSLRQPYLNEELPQDNLYGQYNYILKRLRGQIQIQEEQQSDEQDEAIQIEQFEEDDQLDDEDLESEESSDYIEGEDDCLRGQELLAKQFTLVGPEALKEQLLTRSLLDETQKRINNMTMSINRSKRMDNIFNSSALNHNSSQLKGEKSKVLQPQLTKLIHENQQKIYSLEGRPK